MGLARPQLNRLGGAKSRVGALESAAYSYHASKCRSLLVVGNSYQGIVGSHRQAQDARFDTGPHGRNSVEVRRMKGMVLHAFERVDFGSPRLKGVDFGGPTLWVHNRNPDKDP